MDAPHPRVGDAFGQALLTVLAGAGSGRHVIERDDGMVDSMDASDYFQAPEGWPPLDRAALDLLGGRVLDVGAGAGRLALALQDRGHDPLALDTSAGAVEVCSQRGVRSVFLGTVGDLAARSPARFDAIALMGNNLALLASVEESRRLLDALASLIVPRGVVVGTMLDPYLTDDEWHLAYHRSNRERGRFAGQIRMRVRFRDLATEWFDYLFVSPDELAGLAAEAGWSVVDVTEPAPNYLAILRMT